MYSNTELEAMHGGIPEITQVNKLIIMLETTNIPFEVTECHGARKCGILTKNIMFVMQFVTGAAMVIKLVLLKSWDLPTMMTQ